MGYTKRWIPPTIAYPNNLTAWKAICQDIHDNLVDGGLLVAGDSGQLDISTVTPLPAHGTFAGFKMYQVSDDVSTLPIFIKLEFGVNLDGLAAWAGYGVNKTPRIRVTIGTATDGVGNITGTTIQYQCPQSVTSADGSDYTTPSSNGVSAICVNEDRGFVGMYYQIGGRDSANKSNPYGGYVGCSFNLSIQRTYDSEGAVTDAGFIVLYPDLSLTDNTQSIWYNGHLRQSKCVVYNASTDEVSYPTATLSRCTQHPYQVQISSDFVFAFDPEDGAVEMNTMAVTKMNALAVGQIVDVALAPGITQTMISLGRENNMSFYTTRGQDHCLLMLWE